MNRSFTGFIAILLVLALSRLPLSAAEPTTRPSVFDNPADLKKLADALADQCEKLQQENILLKAQMLALSEQNVQLKKECNQIIAASQSNKTSPFSTVPSTQPQSSPKPSGYSFQFNGQQIFLVPLNNTGSAGSSPRVIMNMSLQNLTPAEIVRQHLNSSVDLIDDRVKAK